ncbi:TniB family NTP-binding protein [Pseudoxanthomonas sp. PXM01]|uniref:TniB family NTP-binding protein n=1 Tax=Pseudoxanthomonas sp. PXM01 TaxID=2769295 RepID=UPI0017837516|nr:TniB family NTP-binding protein [Pseudoxanthomonas sp. PXM01]MBD9471251.1 TniB family NTP-binding protein [Pseudoxanthomonas sp. PXM01]
MNTQINPELPLLKHMDIVKNLCIATPSYSGIQRELRRTLRETASTSTPACKHFVGYSRTGKSFAFREFESGYPAERTDQGLRKEVIYVQAPVRGTIKGLMEALLRALGDPLWMVGTYSNMLARLLTLLEEAQTKMIILDEFQHLIDKGQRALLAGTTDWLKALVEPNTFSLICVGLPSSKELIFRSEQLSNRFDPTIEVPVYDWTNPHSQKVFRSILHAIQEKLAPFELPQLSNPDMALRMYLATGGRIGLLSKLLDRAAKNAIWDNRTAIRVQDLHDAFTTAIWYAEKSPIQQGPFLGTLDPATTAHLCAQSMALAARVPLEEADLQTHLGTLQSPRPPRRRAVRRELARAVA